MDEEFLARFDALCERVERMDELLEEFLPMIRAYLDPDQDGPRGWFMRRQLARSNGHG